MNERKKEIKKEERKGRGPWKYMREREKMGGGRPVQSFEDPDNTVYTQSCDIHASNI